MSFDEASFKEKLESQHDFPGPYIFKFIAPIGQKHEVLAILPEGASIKFRESANSKYISITVEAVMQTSDDIIAVYLEASTINDVIAL
ncbi:MAG: DUF493 family protein [Bacteroidota bacterium]